jgi:hypothetical protein
LIIKNNFISKHNSHTFHVSDRKKSTRRDRANRDLGFVVLGQVRWGYVLVTSYGLAFAV